MAKISPEKCRSGADCCRLLDGRAAERGLAVHWSQNGGSHRVGRIPGRGHVSIPMKRELKNGIRAAILKAIIAMTPVFVLALWYLGAGS